jgi:uncharacterized protein (DUF1501 family)
MACTRRQFLQSLTAGALTLYWPVARAAGPLWDRTLLLLELNGGNDGLNTLVPYADSAYYAARPRLAIERGQVLQLSPLLGLHPALEPLWRDWQQGQLAVVPGVGYAQPNRSHFRSIEIWDTASNSEETLATGWLARLFERQAPPRERPADGIVIGRNAAPLTGGQTRAVVMQDAGRFLRQAQHIESGAAAAPNPALAHILGVRSDVRQAAAQMGSRLDSSAALGTTFPQHRFGRDIETAARLIASGAHAPVIKLAHGSFDTHSNQRGTHERLLRELAEGLSAFRTEMQARGLWDRVLVMTYSEFGRRVAENGSQGTDHGTAAPQFLLGGRVKGGIYGSQPSLTQLDAGDLRHTTDYRSLYVTAAQWWGLPGDFLGKRFPAIACLA